MERLLAAQLVIRDSLGPSVARAREKEVRAVYKGEYDEAGKH